MRKFASLLMLILLSGCSLTKRESFEIKTAENYKSIKDEYQNNSIAFNKKYENTEFVITGTVLTIEEYTKEMRELPLADKDAGAGRVAVEIQGGYYPDNYVGLFFDDNSSGSVATLSKKQEIKATCSQIRAVTNIILGFKGCSFSIVK